MELLHIAAPRQPLLQADVADSVWNPKYGMEGGWSLEKWLVVEYAFGGPPPSNSDYNGQ